MKYYKGTIRKKKSSKDKLSSPESQNTSKSVEGNEVSKDETTINSQSSSSKKGNVVGRKRPSSSSSLTEKQSTGQTKRTKTKHTRPEEEPNKNRKTYTEKLPDSSDDNYEPKMSNKSSSSSLTGKQSTGQTKRTKTKHARPEEEPNKNRKTNTEKLPDSSDDNNCEPKMSNNRKKKSQSTTTSITRGSRRDGSLRNKVKSSDVIESNSSSIADKRRETKRNVYGTVQKKSARKTHSKPTAPNSPKSDSSESAESVFEDDKEEMSSKRKKKYQSTTVRSSTRGSRRDGSSRKKVKSSDIIESNSSSIADKRKEKPKNVYETVQKKSTKKTKSKPNAPNSPKSDSSETAESVFEDDEEGMSSKRKKKYLSTTVRSSTRGSRRDGSSRKKVKSSDIIESNSSSIADKRREKPKNVYETVQKKALRKTNSKPTAPNSTKSDSSESAESDFEDDQEGIQPTDRRGASENNFEISSGGDISSDGVISCSEFLQQQVRILKSEFEIEDCPELAAHLQGTKRQQKNHIPKETVFKVLRKLNFKVEDELLKSLNRQAQRTILKQVDEIKTSYGMTGKKTSIEENTGQEPEGKVEKLKETLVMLTAELDGLKRMTDMAAKIESMAEGFYKNPMVEEIKRTNELMQKINQKVRKEGFTNTHQETLTTKGPLSHQEIVNKLFS